MITVAIVDDHHAVRLGLYAAIRSEPDLVNAGTATNAAELAPPLYRTHPDVVVLDHHLPGDDGLDVCWRIKRDVPAPRVILYSAFGRRVDDRPRAGGGRRRAAGQDRSDA